MRRFIVIVDPMSLGFADDDWMCPRRFCFKYFERNELLRRNSFNILPEPSKTGTTSVGIIFQDGVIIGSDTQRLDNNLREDNAYKLHYLSDNIFCCASGLCADNYWASKFVSADLKLFELETKRQSRIITAVKHLKQTLFQYQGALDVNVIIGGVDLNGSNLVTIYPHGSSDKLPYSAIGLGAIPAMSVLENKYGVGLGEDEALKLLVDSISSGIYNDLSSGSSINAVVITKDGFTQKKFNIESKTREQQLVMKKDFVIEKTEVQRFELMVIDEKTLK